MKTPMSAAFVRQREPVATFFRGVLLRIEAFIDHDPAFFEEYRGQKLVVFDPALADAARSHAMQVEQVPEPRADVIARLGWEKIQLGETAHADELEANYIRRSDAEIFAKRS